MKLTPVKLEQRGMALLDCVLYIALLMVVLSMAFAGFYAVLDHTTRLNRNAADISRAVQAGEQWREDIRAATGAPKASESSDHMAFHIPQPKAEVVYLFKTNTLFRQIGTNEALPFLSQVKDSRMHLERRQFVTSCRWELELESRHEKSRLKPRFSFQAVSGGK